MTKSSLALIGHAVGTALEAKTRTITRHVAGFVVQEEVPVAGEAAARSYQHDSQVLGDCLKRAEIEPIAVLPTRWWKQIIAQSELVDFAPNGGFVSTNAGSHVRAIRKSWAPTALFWGVSLILAGLALGVFEHLLTLYPPDNAILLARVAVAIPAMLVGMFVTVLFALSDNVRAFLNASIYVRRSGGNRALLRSLLQDDDDSHGRSRRVAVTLPTPPDDVMQVLVRADKAELSMRVAAVPEAVELAVSPRRLIQAELADTYIRESEQRRIERAARLDPIVYVVIGSSTAIIAQFGDFPIEHETVEAAIAQTRI